MSGFIPVAEYQSEAEIRAAAIERRKRFYPSTGPAFPSPALVRKAEPAELPSPAPAPQPRPKPTFVLLPAAPPKSGSLASIMESVAAAHGLTRAEMLSLRRHPSFVNARFEFFYRALAETNRSTSEIGRFCGGRDHTTIIHGVTTHCRRNGLAYPRARKTPETPA